MSHFRSSYFACQTHARICLQILFNAPKLPHSRLTNFQLFDCKMKMSLFKLGNGIFARFKMSVESLLYKNTYWLWLQCDT